MSLHIEIHKPEVIAILERRAARLHKPVGAVIEEMVESQPEEESASHDPHAFSRRCKQIRDELLAERGGELFSDSAEIIRHSRDHDW